MRKVMTILLPLLSLALGRPGGGRGVSDGVMVTGLPRLSDSLLCGSCLTGVNEAG